MLLRLTLLLQCWLRMHACMRGWACSAAQATLPCPAPASSPPRAVRMLSFDAWRRYIDQLAPLLANATQRAPVVWRTTIPIREDAFRDRNGTTYFSAGHFQARC